MIKATAKHSNNVFAKYQVVNIPVTNGTQLIHVQFDSHSSFLAGNPERARKIGIMAMAPKEKATNGR